MRLGKKKRSIVSQLELSKCARGPFWEVSWMCISKFVKCLLCLNQWLLCETTDHLTFWIVIRHARFKCQTAFPVLIHIHYFSVLPFSSLVRLSHPGCCLCIIYYFPSKFPYSSMSTVENKQTLISMCDPLVVNRLISTWVQCENGFHRDGRGRWAHRLPYWGL